MKVKTKTLKKDKPKKALFKLIKAQAFRKKKVVLSSGKISNYYVDIRKISLTSKGAFLIANLLWDELKKHKFSSLGGPTLGADPILSAVAYHAFLNKRNLKTFIVRKTQKKHGQARFIEGPTLKKGSKVIIIDDVATTGKSLVESIQKLSGQKVKVIAAFVVVDREEGAKEILAKYNLPLFSIFKLSEFI